LCKKYPDVCQLALEEQSDLRNSLLAELIPSRSFIVSIVPEEIKKSKKSLFLFFELTNFGGMIFRSALAMTLGRFNFSVRFGAQIPPLSM
jgi:hypothetical protein